MRALIPQPCIGSRVSVLSTRRSSVPRRTSAGSCGMGGRDGGGAATVGFLQKVRPLLSEVKRSAARPPPCRSGCAPASRGRSFTGAPAPGRLAPPPSPPMAAQPSYSDELADDVASAPPVFRMVIAVASLVSGLVALYLHL